MRGSTKAKRRERTDQTQFNTRFNANAAAAAAAPIGASTGSSEAMDTSEFAESDTGGAEVSSSSGGGGGGDERYDAADAYPQRSTQRQQRKGSGGGGRRSGGGSDILPPAIVSFSSTFFTAEPTTRSAAVSAGPVSDMSGGRRPIPIPATAATITAEQIAAATHGSTIRIPISAPTATPPQIDSVPTASSASAAASAAADSSQSQSQPQPVPKQLAVTRLGHVSPAYQQSLCDRVATFGVGFIAPRTLAQAGVSLDFDGSSGKGTNGNVKNQPHSSRERYFNAAKQPPKTKKHGSNISFASERAFTAAAAAAASTNAMPYTYPGSSTAAPAPLPEPPSVYASYPLAHRTPAPNSLAAGDRIAYKTVSLSAQWSPEVSKHYLFAEVVAYMFSGSGENDTATVSCLSFDPTAPADPNTSITPLIALPTELPYTDLWDIRVFPGSPSYQFYLANPTENALPETVKPIHQRTGAVGRGRGRGRGRGGSSGRGRGRGDGSTSDRAGSIEPESISSRADVAMTPAAVSTPAPVPTASRPSPFVRSSALLTSVSLQLQQPQTTTVASGEPTTVAPASAAPPIAAPTTTPVRTRQRKAAATGGSADSASGGGVGPRTRRPSRNAVMSVGAIVSRLRSHSAANSTTAN